MQQGTANRGRRHRHACDSCAQLASRQQQATLGLDDDTTATGSLAGIDVASGSTLTLDDNTQIQGGGSGTLTVESSGQLAIATPTGATLDGVKVTDDNITDGIDVASGAVLTLDDGTQVIGAGTGTMTIEGTGQLAITAGALTDGATLSGATLDGVIVTDNSALAAGGIEVSGTTLTLKDGTAIKGAGTGTLVIDSGAQLAVTTATGATLDNVIVDDDTTATGSLAGIDVASGSTLTLDDNTQIQGGGSGTLTVESSGQLAIATPTGATLDGVKVTDDNITDGIDVASGAVLTLDDGTQVIGAGTGTMTIEGTGQLAITAGALTDGATLSGATLDGVIVTDNSALAAGGIEVSGTTLTLKDGTAIKGAGTGTLVIDSGAQLAVTTATGATLDNVIVDDDTTATGSLAGIDVASGSTLTLDDNTQIQGGGSGTLTVESSGQLAIATPTGATLDGVKVTDDNITDGIDVASGAVLTLDDGTQVIGAGTGTMTIEGTGQLAITAGALTDGATLSGATLDGVIVTDNSALAAGGIEVSGTTLTLKDGTAIKGAGTGTLVIDSGAQLAVTTATGATLDNVIVDDDTTATGSLAGIDVASGSTLTLDDNTQIQGGGSGTLTVESSGQLAIATPTGATLDGVKVTDDNITDGIDVASGAVLTLDDGTQVIGAGTGTMTIEGTGQLAITAGALTDGATLSGATLDGVIVTNDQAIIVSGGSLTLDSGTTITNAASGTITVDFGASLTLNGTDSISGGSLINVGTIALGTASAAATLDLGGTVSLSGAGTFTLENSGDVITGVAAGGTLDNASTIAGVGTIDNSGGSLTLDNQLGGVIDANVSGGTLILDTGANTIVNTGTLEATSDGTLQIESDVGNSGTIEASGGSTLDVQADTISWTGSAAPAAGQGIVLADSADVFEVDTPIPMGGTHGTLTLTTVIADGGQAGALSLSGGTIEGGGHAVTLDNSDDAISGYGTIGTAGVVGGNTNLTLQNDEGGTIDANFAGANTDHRHRQSGR